METETRAPPTWGARQNSVGGNHTAEAWAQSRTTAHQTKKLSRVESSATPSAISLETSIDSVTTAINAVALVFAIMVFSATEATTDVASVKLNAAGLLGRQILPLLANMPRLVVGYWAPEQRRDSCAVAANAAVSKTALDCVILVVQDRTQTGSAAICAASIAGKAVTTAGSLRVAQKRYTPRMVWKQQSVLLTMSTTLVCVTRNALMVTQAWDPFAGGLLRRWKVRNGLSVAWAQRKMTTPAPLLLLIKLWDRWR